MTAEHPPASTIPGLLRWRVTQTPDAVAIEDHDRALTWRQLADAVEQLAGGLIAREIAPGDVVAIQAPNHGAWIVAALAVHSVGATLLPLNTRYKGHETAWILGRARARALFTASSFLGCDYLASLRAAAGGAGASTPVADLPELRFVVTLPPASAEQAAAPRDSAGESGSGSASHPAGAHVLTFEQLDAAGARVPVDVVRARAAAVTPDTLSDLLFTSGTTGHPRGVMTTHEQNLRVFWTWSGVVGLDATDRYLIVNPFFHAFGYKAGWLACLMRGATILPHPVFDVAAVLERVARERITVLPGPPALYQSLLATPDLASHDLSSLRLAVTGAAAIPVSLIARMRTELGFRAVLTAYGLTESCGVVSMCRPGDPDELVATTSGRAIPGVELRIAGSDGAPLPPGEAGEILVRGYNVMLGYLDEPERTRETIDADGWLHTGDVGVVDDAGNVRITDRMKDMFIVGGFNAYPAEIESTLLSRPEIAHAAVIGVPDERLGEVGAAYLVLAPGATLDTDELHAWCRERMANYKVPRSFTVLDDLPRNATGKVQKFLLRERAAS